MKCEAIQNRLPALAGGDLDREGVRLCEEHLASCAVCRGRYADLQATLRSVGGNPLVEAVNAEWQQSFTRLRQVIFERQAPGLGALLGKDAEKGTLVLSSGSAAVRTTLDGFLVQSFVQFSGERQSLVTPDGAYRVSWNEETLRQTVQLSDAYGAFLTDRLPAIYPDIREVVRGTALERLGMSMPALVSQARRVERITRPASDVQALQDILSGEVAELKRVGGTLRQILDQYERVGLKPQHSEMYRQLQDDTREILRRLDLILDKEDLYRVSAKLQAWRGQRPPSFDAFDVDDAEGLNQYLKAQRTRHYPGWPRALQSLRAWYEKERMLGMLTLFLGSASMHDLGLPIRPPWPFVYILPLNVLRYHILGRTAWGRRRLAAWGQRTTERILESYFVGEAAGIRPLNST